MKYADYLSTHSFLHTLSRNLYLGAYPRLPESTTSEGLVLQLQLLKAAIESGKR